MCFAYFNFRLFQFQLSQHKKLEIIGGALYYFFNHNFILITIIREFKNLNERYKEMKEAVTKVTGKRILTYFLGRKYFFGSGALHAHSFNTNYINIQYFTHFGHMAELGESTF